MKIDLDVSPLYAPLQMQGAVGEYSVYYRARNQRWELWINVTGVPVEQWLPKHADTPTASGFCTAAEENSLKLAMGLILSTIGDWEDQCAAEAAAEAEAGFIADISHLGRT